jgi:adenylate kinase
MSRLRPNILITGTPGVGKSLLAGRLGLSLGMRVINVGQFAKEKGCLGAWDEAYESHELEEDRLLDLLEEEVGKGEGGLLVEHHVTDLFPERWFDLVLVLRCDNTRLHDRLTARGYSGRKLEENVQCEIFQTVLEEARASYREEVVVELPSNTEEEMAGSLARAEAWARQWQQDREKVRPGKRRAERAQ